MDTGRVVRIVAGGAALLGAGLLVRGIVSQRGGGSTASSPSAATDDSGGPVSVSPQEAALHKAMRPIILDAFRLAGQTATPAAIQYMSAVAWLETRDGTGWPPNMAQAHNWGAVQCDTKKEGPETCIPHKDHTSGGDEFSVGFRRYPSDVEGAADVVKHIFKHRPRTAAALAEANPSIYRASYAMRREKYYGGICTTPMKDGRTTKQEANDSFAHPDATPGTRACAEDNVGQHARIVLRNAKAVAQTLGEPLALRLGTYADADSWWRGSAA